MLYEVLRRLEKVIKQRMDLHALKRAEAYDSLRVEMLLHHPSVFAELVAIRKKSEDCIPAHHLAE